MPLHRQYGTDSAVAAVEKLRKAHPRGWAFLAKNSEKDLYFAFQHLFRNNQRSWNIAKKVLKQVDRDLAGARTLSYFDDDPRARVVHLWDYFSAMGPRRGLLH